MIADCSAALESLRRTLELPEGEDLDAVARLHLEGCVACRARLAAAMAALGDEPSSPPADAARPEAAARAGYRRRLGLRALRLGLALAGAALLGLAAAGTFSAEGSLTVVVVVALGAVAGLAMALARLPGRLGLFKRLRPGRQISGVCLGLAERTGTPVVAWRAAFLVLLLAKGWGLWLYLLLDLAMPVHPEDRPGLLRYRLGRWWRGRWAGRT
jgi:phage shock protein PspC (stress-responsive transcriptional regulator)